MTDNKGSRRSLYESINNYPYYGDDIAQINLQASCKNSLDFVQRMDVVKTLNVHSGCVNTVNWNASGTHFVSGSDDNHLVITEAKSGQIMVKTKTMHKRHIFSARFMPHCNDQALISCSGEGVVIHTEFLEGYGGARTLEDAMVGESGRIANLFDCHAFGSTYDVLPLPDCPRTFLSCGEDGTVRCIDLRVCNRCSESVCEKHIFITAPCAVTAMDVAPISHNKIAIGCSDSIVRIYDRRMLGFGGNLTDRLVWPLKAYPIPMRLTRRHYRPTCVKFSDDESELLVSYSMEQLYLYDLEHEGYNDAELLASGCYTPKLRRDDDDMEPQMPRLRFRGDWSDTGPNSMASGEQVQQEHNVGQARPPLEPGVLSRLSDEIFRMLNAPSRPRAGAGTGMGGGSANGPTGSGLGTGRGSDRPLHNTWQAAILHTLELQRENNGSPNRPAPSLFLNTLRHSDPLGHNPIDPLPLSPPSPDDDPEEPPAAVTPPPAPAPPPPPPPPPPAVVAVAPPSPPPPPPAVVAVAPPSPEVVAAAPPEPPVDAATEAPMPEDKKDEETTAKPSTVDASVETDPEPVADGAAANGEPKKFPLTKFDYVKMSFSGHRNSRTMVKGACFWGDDYIMSGSDCGHIFVWNRKTGKVVKTLLADQRVVNRVQPHPTLPYLLSSGIDYNVKMWAPIGAMPTFDEAETAGLIKSNEIMLVETRDTITVPAQIMIRILASLHQYRRLMHSGGELTVSGNSRHEQVAVVANEEEEDEDEDDEDAEEEEDEPMDTEEHAVAVVDGVSFDLNVEEEEEEDEEEVQHQLDHHIHVDQEEEEEQQIPVDPLLNNANANADDDDDDSNQMSN